MTDYLVDHALCDAEEASKAGIDSDNSYNLRFFVMNIADDMLDDTFGTMVGPEEKEHLCHYILNNKDDRYKLNNLTDFRFLMHKWMCDKHSKKAYPNTFGKDNKETVYDRYKWVTTIKAVYSLLKEKGISKDAAIEIATVDWTTDERFKFTNWLKYYESGITEKYNVKTAKIKKDAFDPVDLDELGLPAHMLDPETRSNNVNNRPQSSYKLRKEKNKREDDLQRAKHFKIKMKSRLRSLRKLLDRYNDILPHQSIENIQDEMYTLDKSVSKLNIYSSLEDCTIRSANRIRKMGFDEGADLLCKFAKDPLAATDPINDTGAVVESLPPAESPQPSTPNVDLSMVIQRLEGLTKLLKSRDLIRDMASVDILLNELGLASYFPELGDSQSKLIEAYSYASNRVESIVSKLRGTGKSISKPAKPAETAELPEPAQKPIQNQKIDKRELESKPVGPMKKELPPGR